MTPNKWMRKIYQAFTKYKLSVYLFGYTNQCDPVEKPSKIHYDYFKSVTIKEMFPERIEMKYIAGADLGGGCRGCAPPLPLR